MWENAKYNKGIFGEVSSISAEKNGWMYSIPINEESVDYQQIMQLVDEGKLIIAPAEVAK